MVELERNFKIQLVPFTQNLQTSGTGEAVGGSHAFDQHQWHCRPVHCAPRSGHFSCSVFPDKYCLLSIYTRAGAEGLEPQGR